MEKRAKKSSVLKPLGDRVVIRPLSDEEITTKTASGIIIPETVKDDKSDRGVVVAVGAGRRENGKRIPLSVKVGDTVLFQWGDTFEFDGEKYYVLREDSILAVIE